MTQGVLADLILIVHFLYVLGVVLPIPFIILGKFLNWRWVRRFWLRTIHLAMVSLVLLEAVFGMVCPLTLWEDQLRSSLDGPRYEKSFIEYWLAKILFYDFEPWVFIVLYFFISGVIWFLYFYFCPPIYPKRRRF